MTTEYVESEHWIGFVISPTDRVEVFAPDGAITDVIEAHGLYQRLLSAGYPAGPFMLGLPNQDEVIDLSFNPDHADPEVIAYLTSRDPAERERTMGEASAVFLDWWRQQ